MAAFARKRRVASERAEIAADHDEILRTLDAPEEPSAHVREWFGKAAMTATQASGSVWAFAVAITVILVWGITGPLFHFSDTWQLVINTGTTIVTFLMVFLIQHSQNRDTKALHIKLNELIAAVEGASNQLIDVEDLSETQLDRLSERFQKLANAVRDMHGQSKGGAADEALTMFKENMDKKFHR
jgi:low affinity Fe/Cu permease